MKTTLITSKADRQWLRDVHLPRNAPAFRAAVIHGNEDHPQRIDLYWSMYVGSLIGRYQWSTDADAYVFQAEG